MASGPGLRLFSTALLGGIVASIAWAHGWTEAVDAGRFPDQAAQVTRGAGRLESILGATSAGDEVDAYCVRVVDPRRFLATTDPAIDPHADATFDTRLFLFRADGRPLLANDDSPGDPSRSTLTAAATDGSGVVLSKPGNYVLAVTGAPRTPRDTDAVALFDLGVEPAAVHGPDPLAGRYDRWLGPGATGTYQVALHGVAPCQDGVDVVFGVADAGIASRACLGDGGSGFSCAAIGGTEAQHFRVALGPIDGDEHLDAVFGNGSTLDPDTDVCFGDGRGGFSRCHQLDVVSFDVELGYVDRDEHLDLVIGQRAVEENQVCLGDGNGGFSCSDVSADTNITAGVALGFIDADHDLDVVFANGLIFAEQRNRVCLGDGEGGFACSAVSSDERYTVDVALGYVNDDGTLDAVFANSTTSNQVCLGDGGGGFSCSDLPGGALSNWAVALADVNGDTTLDAVFANGSSTPNTVCLGDGLGGFTCLDANDDQGVTLGVALGFVDRDGTLDAVFANGGVDAGTANRVCLGDGRGRFDRCSDVSADENNTFGVALGALGVDLIFGDGFESADTSAWR